MEFGSRVILDFDPSIAEGMKLTKAQAREIIDCGRSIGLEPIGYLNLLGYLDRGYKRPSFAAHDDILIQNEGSYEKFVYPILSETAWLIARPVSSESAWSASGEIPIPI